jgi:hypothetical protein
MNTAKVAPPLENAIEENRPLATLPELSFSRVIVVAEKTAAANARSTILFIELWNPARHPQSAGFVLAW